MSKVRLYLGVDDGLAIPINPQYGITPDVITQIQEYIESSDPQ